MGFAATGHTMSPIRADFRGLADGNQPVVRFDGRVVGAGFGRRVADENIGPAQVHAMDWLQRRERFGGGFVLMFVGKAWLIDRLAAD